MDKSFTYIISNTDRTNNLPAAGLGIVYDINFGGFSEQYDDYMCEVISFSMTAGIVASNTYWMFCADKLCENGYFCKSQLNPKECILSVIPLNAIHDAYVQSEGSIRFRINNCRVQKQISLFFLQPDFTPVICETDINIPTAGNPPVPVETKWLLTLRMHPIEKGK